jgi:DNA transformation protein
LRNEFVEFVLEGLQPLGGVRARRMFGGWGIYKDGVMFALIARDQLYLKVDDDNRAAYDAADLPYFT